MKNEEKNKYLLKNTFLLSLGNFGSKIISFLLIPLYTNIFTASEYGTLDFMTIISTVIVPLVTLNIHEAVLRFSMDKTNDNYKILSVSMIILIFTILISLVFIPVFNFISFTSQYSILLFIFMLLSAVSYIFVCYLRGNEKILDYSIINIIQTFLIASLNVVFLVKFKCGINGYILAYIVSYIFSIVYCFFRGEIYKFFSHFVFDKKLFFEMIKYSLVLIPNSLMWWIMNSLDRVMVSYMIGVDANGIYAISYKIPSVIITFTTIFNQAWMYSAVKELEDNNKNEYTSNIYNFLFTMLIVISSFLFFILKPLTNIYVGNDFYSSWLYAPPLIIGTMFLTLGTFISNEYTAHKDSLGFLKSSSVGAFVNLILNFILIPKIGLMGASIATCLSYVCVFLFRVVDTKKYVYINYFHKKNVFYLFLLSLSFIFVYLEFNISYFVLFVIFVLNMYISRNYLLDFLLKLKQKIIRKKN